MIYPFKCDQGHYHEFVRPVAEYNQAAICPTCFLPMKRVFTVPSVKVNNAVFNPALGKMVGGNSSTLRDELKKYKDKNGSELVEVGNEIDKSKPNLHDYSLTPKEVAGVERILENAKPD